MSNADVTEAHMDFVNPQRIANWDQMLIIRPGASIFHTTAWAAVLIDIYEKRQRAPEGEHAEHRAAG